jgi:hypothetical protein
MEEQKLKAFLVEEKPTFNRGDKQEIKVKDKSVEVVIRNVYLRRLEDLTFNDLNMIGYNNPNAFVKDWVNRNGSFDINKIVWVVVYAEYKK